MDQFNKLYNEYKLLIESPENFKGEDELVVDSNDVITFAYFINRNSIIYGDTGYFVSHADLLKTVKIKEYLDEINTIGEVEISDIHADNVMMGRIWKNHNKVAIWDYIGDYWGDVNLKQIFRKISKLMKINLMNYELEITPVSGANVYDDDSKVLNFSEI